MEGKGCSRVDLILENQGALAALDGHEQHYSKGISRHALPSAKFNLPTFGALANLPGVPASLMNSERSDLPEGVKEEVVHWALAPAE